jgi:AraC-like DNA-binding protein
MVEPTRTDAAFAYYRRLQRLRAHVESHLHEHLGLEEAAAIAGLERKYFSTFFRRLVGVGYKEWLDTARLRRACDLMASKNYSIAEVADLVGFRSVRTFERTFRKRMDDTPRGFKRRNRPA